MIRGQGGPERIDLDAALSKARIGQRGAINTIVSRIQAGQATTSVVLPVRYGKTDVARIVACYLKQEGLIATTLMLVPSDRLRTQATLKKKWVEAADRYGLPVQLAMGFRPVLGREYDPTSNGECLLVGTIQLILRNIDDWISWADRERRKTRLPVHLLVDESHTGTERNHWGAVAKRFIQEGHHVTLMTATNFRSDGEDLVGFTTKAGEDCEDVRYSRRVDRDDIPEGMRLVQDFRGTRRSLELIPDYRYTFRQAWDESDSPLCKLTRLTFHVQMAKSEVGSDDELTAARAGLLSQLSREKTRFELSRSVRDWRVIRDGVRLFIECLQSWRRNHPTLAGIVYCGSDDEPETRPNRHAREIEAEIKRQAPGLRVLIATNNQGDEANKLLAAFADEGVGDVLIVKQMGGIGMDMDRLKIVLDLSSIRAENACIQRWTRAATRWGSLLCGLVIMPEEKLSKSTWDTFIAGEGGEMRLTEMQLVGERLVPGDDGPEPPEHLHVGGTEPGPFADTLGLVETADRQEEVRFLIQSFPILVETMSYPQIATVMRDTGMRVSYEPAFIGESLQESLEHERAQLNAVVARIVALRTPPGAEPEKDLWPSTYNEIKNSVGRISVALEEITSVREMTEMRLRAERIELDLLAERKG